MIRSKVKLDSYFILLASGLMMFLINFDIPGVNLAVPEMMENYDVSVNNVQWIVISYTLIASVFMIVLSALSKQIGSKRFFLIGVLLFSVASIIISTGISVEIIILGRMLQGLGMAFVYPQIMVQCTTSFPAKHKGLIISIITFIACFAQAVAPVLSSVLINYMGWESIFLLNVPCGIFILFLANRYFIKDMIPINLKFDYLGSGLLIVLLFLIGVTIPFYSQLNLVQIYICLLIIFVLVIVSYFLSKIKIIDIFSILSLFRNKQFFYSTCIRFLFMLVFGAIIFSVNIMLREIIQISIVNTGLLFLFLTASLSISTLITGFKINNIGYKNGFILGNIFMILACISLLFLEYHYLSFSFTLIIFGIGLGINMTTSSAGAITSFHQEKAGLATSIFFTAVFLSFSIGTSVSATILSGNSNLIVLNNYHIVLKVCLACLVIGLLLSFLFKEVSKE